MTKLLVALGALSLLLVPSTAAAQEAPPQGPAKLHVGLQVTGFKAQGKKDLVATGVATATLTDSRNGAQFTSRQKVTLKAQSGGSCTVLKLTLDQLNLTLLGLNVNLDKVNLGVTGQTRGGVLGKLFCRLARSDIRASRVQIARNMTAAVRKKPLRPMAFAVNVAPVATGSQAAPVCNVLALTLGPLNLELLGLVVDLDKVNLIVTANPNGGTLGQLFCRLAAGG